jgi:predicted pyridoxine 5'-phosphate oxidase superfamily flavin-nucleotide-binding protein
MKSDPFHDGELAAQRLAGQIAAGHGIRDFMPDQHREFFAQLPFVLLASAGDDGAPQARLLHGAPGFVGSPDPQTLTLACTLTLKVGAQVGLLGIDFATRRRNRANGVVRSCADGVLTLSIDESFGNCPKYITLRDVEAAPREPGPVSHAQGLDEAARAMIAAADTFFVATSGAGHGLDISHRGGPPGFVGIDGDTLLVPDFSGNRYFNTMGNMLVDPRAALLFIDFDSGDVLTLAGSVSISWEEGARGWRLRCSGVTRVKGAVPLRWRPRPR